MRNGLTFVRRDSGQSIVETVLMIPLLLLLLLNAVNFGYFFLTVLNLTGATRNGLEYGIIGSATPAASAQPSPGPANCSASTDPGCLSVTYLVQQDMTGALSNPTSATVRVCSQANTTGTPAKGLNGTGTGQKANCISCTGTTCGTVDNSGTNVDADPEAPSFVLNRVDVTYTFVPLIPGRPFNISLLAACGSGTSCSFHRWVEMRAMN
jgi:Flp pilus assembly protein TadG